ncbi:MAG: ECF transporter S component [Clostridia bacterium]|nr:ECF transporter S component [Clostridia bacterium]MBR3810233.1 ECF transporter S component [Clostridia bacterium]
MKNRKLKLTIISALFAALVCVATMVVKIPTPLNGYINLGDCVILVAAFTLPCGYGFLAAGIGSCLADILSGYTAYAPATFVIKGFMVLVVCLVTKLLKVNKSNFVKVVSGVLAELTMVLGYYIFEGFMYGFVPSLANIPMNLIQGVAGLVLAVVLIKVLEKQKLIEKLKIES